MKNKFTLMILAVYLLSCFNMAASASTTGFNETHDYATIVPNVKPYPQLELVSQVDGFKKFRPRWNDRFSQGSTLMVYADALDVSHARFIAVDFIFLIKDPKGHIVSWDRVQVRKIGYETNAYAVYEKEIPEDWIDGQYRIEAFAYDRVNFTKIMQYEYNYDNHIGDEDYWDDFWEIEDDDSSDIGAGFTNPISESRVIMHFREKIFYVDHSASEYPPDRFMFSDLKILPEVVAPGEESYLRVNVSNTFTDPGDVDVYLIFDNRTVASRTVTLDPYSEEMVEFTIPPQKEGEHQIQITSPTENTAGVPILAILNVSMEAAEELSSELPTNIVVKSLDIEKLQVDVNETLPINLTVQNLGKEGTGTVQIEINGEPEAEKNVTLGYLETTVVTFDVRKEHTGTYRVTVPGTQLSRLFFVVEGGTGEAQSFLESAISKSNEEVPMIYIILIAMLLLILIFLRIYIAKR